MNVSRRTLFASIAPGALLAVAGCTAAQQASLTTAYNNFLAQVQAIVAKGCNLGAGFIPAIPSIEAVVNALYPGLGVAVAGVAGAITTVSSALCTAIPAGGTTASLRKRLLRSSVALPVIIGTIAVNGQPITVTGYK